MSWFLYGFTVLAGISSCNSAGLNNSTYFCLRLEGNLLNWMLFEDRGAPVILDEASFEVAVVDACRTLVPVLSFVAPRLSRRASPML